MSSQRQEYNEISPWWGEHVHRYEYVVKQLKGTEKILDIACGNGYGTYILSTNTNNDVFGGDIDNSCIEDCKKRFIRPNLFFNVVDGAEIPFPDNLFDVVVSFETIEHTTAYLKMCKEFHRVLKHDGILFLSTPNIKINSPNGIVENPFHTQEFTLNELKDIISQAGFRKAEYFGQKYTRYNKPSFRNKTALIFEKLFYMRGIRKIPIKWQERFMKLFNGIGHYPKSSDFSMVFNEWDVLRCKTFFVKAKK